MLVVRRQGIGEPIYYPMGTDDPLMLRVGRKIYEEFSTVVILREQVRVMDRIRRYFLDHLRHGRVESWHLKMLRMLLLKRQTPDSHILFRRGNHPQPAP